MEDGLPSDAVALRTAEIAAAPEVLHGLAQRWRDQPWWPALTNAAPGPVTHEVWAFTDVLNAGGALLQLRDTWKRC